MKILLVHGIGHSDSDPNYYAAWKSEIIAGLKASGLGTAPTFVEFHYDDLFDAHYSGPGTYALAVTEMLGAATYQAVGDFFHGIFRPSRGFTYGGDTLRWFAGMVAQFVVEGGLRRDLRNRLAETLVRENPDLIAAHSLGTLLTFDFLHNDPRASASSRRTYLTFGSQINNVFVRSRLWPGRIVLPPVAAWYHLFNHQDKVFTADIALPGVAAFRSVATPSAAGHSPTATNGAPGYLNHANTQRYVWTALAQRGGARTITRTFSTIERAAERPRRRALLIGINDYPRAEDRLEGCVNDVFLMSSVLQERGFAAEDIRVVLNERATAAGIRERLAWLLEDASDGMERVLFYSGHGAQLPGYNSTEKVDHVDECLVPHDFAWSKETAIIDDDFFRLYSDLPFGARLFTIFDCCHSGGMTRDGSHKARGLTPPDDIRHRLLEWNTAEEMWQERKLPPINDNFGGKAEDRKKMMGANGATFRLGRAMRLRQHTSASESDRLVAEKRAIYLPVIIQACGENQLSYEYRHGTVSYGAFTYALAKNLRNEPSASFSHLVARTTDTLGKLGYDQIPQLVGPSKILKLPVPGREVPKTPPPTGKKPPPKKRK